MQKREGKIIGFVVLLLDRLGKLLAWQLGSVQINQGVSFGILPFRFMVQALTGLLVAVMVVLLWKRKIIHPGWWLILGGGLSNLLDRLIYGGVVDFIHLPLVPVFNLADVAIVSGVIWLLLTWIKITR